MATAPSSPPAHVYSQRVAHLQRGENPAECVLANGAKLLMPALLASHLAVGDEIRFPIASPSTLARTEICVEKNPLGGRSRQLYQAPIGYVTQPKIDTRKRHFVSAEVQQSSFGIVSVFLPCEVLRDYFYRISPDRGRGAQSTLYEVLRMPATASPAELRVGFQTSRSGTS